MRYSTLLSFASLLAAASFASADESSDVLSLTPDTFQLTVEKAPLILVEFFAPWCGHCKALAPHYEEAATTLKEKNIKLAKVDCVEHADLCQKQGVTGYPTLKVFRYGEKSEYTGPRKADGIISYMTKQSLPPVAEVTAENHEDFQKADKVVLIAYLSSPTEAPGPEFSATADKHRDDYLFGLTTDKDAIAAAGVTPPAIVLYRKFDEPKVEFTSHVASASLSELESFINDYKIPLVDEVGADNYKVYADSALPLAYLFLDPTDSAKEERIDALRPVAAKYKGQVNFVWIDAIKFGDHAKALNLHEAKWPSFVVQDLKKQLKYPLDQSEEVTTEAITLWLESFVAGELEPELKSEAIPEANDEPVAVVVGKTFNEIVLDESKAVFIEFYAPWCGHCKRLKPTWDSLAERYANVKDQLVIAKMDATENDLPPSVDFRITGFPTLKFKAAGSTEFVDYSGDRSLESLIEFVEEQTEHSLKAKPAAVPEEEEEVVLSASSVEHEATPVPHEHHDEL